MKRFPLHSIVFSSLLSLVACASVTDEPGVNGDGLAGAPGTGGLTGSTGGTTATGATTGSGGVFGVTGGTGNGTGATAATGGSASGGAASGGAATTGGTASTGGTATTGGTTSTGGGSTGCTNPKPWVGNSQMDVPVGGLVTYNSHVYEAEDAIAWANGECMPDKTAQGYAAWCTDSQSYKARPDCD